MRRNRNLATSSLTLTSLPTARHTAAPMIPPAQRMMLLNVGLGTLVVAVGFWLLWGAFPAWVVALWALLVAALLHWKCRTITEIWAWSTLLLGLESFAWPLQLMIQLQSAASGPSDEEMGTILSAVVLGLFSSVFWLSFSYGLFKRKPGILTSPTIPPTPVQAQTPSKRKHR